MEREIPDENTITPEHTRRGVEEMLRRVSARDVLLTTEQWAQLEEDLARAPLVALMVTPLRMRDRVFQPQSESTLDDIVDDVVTYLRTGESRLVDGAIYTPRSAAGALYLYFVSIYLDGDAEFRDEYVNPGLWDEDDVAGMHQAFYDALSYIMVRREDPKLRRPAIHVMRALYDGHSAEYRPGLLTLVERKKVDWLNLLHLCAVTDFDTAIDALETYANF